YQKSTANIIPRPGFTGATTTNNLNLYNFFSASATLNQLIWDFGQTTGRWRSAQAGAEASADQERSTAQLILLQVRSAFFTSRAGKDLVVVARENLDNQRKHLEQIQGFVEAGTRPQIDLSAARAATANAEVQLTTAENAYITSKVQLNQAMGVEGPIDYDVADEELPAIAGEEGDPAVLLQQAIAARPDIASLEQQVRAQQLTLHSIRGAYWPSLGGTFGFTQGGTKIDDLGWNLSAGVSLTWQLFQGGLTNAQVRESEANIVNAVAQLDTLRQQVRVDVEQARLAIRAGKATLVSAQQALVSARDVLAQAEARYQNGAGSVIELGDAQVASAQAGAQVVQAEFQLATARAQLLRALGRP
ncbi:MAG TPA: TolC family protein, partial [Myxococcales bacterium]|nr:TolC family protein [Myxococcales bacterium]